jgi:hypothetical protein
VVAREFLGLHGRRSVLGTYSISPTGDSTLDDLATYRVAGRTLRYVRRVGTPLQGA